MKYHGTLYFHSDKSSNEMYFKEAVECSGKEFSEINEDAKLNARYAAYELELSGYWDDDGNFTLTHVQSAKVSPKIKI